MQIEVFFETKDMHLKRFFVKGYRSFSDTVQLDDIGHIVVIYGINNVGKTNLLRALALFSYVCRQDLFRLINRTKQNAKNFYEEIYSLMKIHGCFVSMATTTKRSFCQPPFFINKLSYLLSF